MRMLFTTGFLLTGLLGMGQALSPLTVEKIMRDPKWIGTSPANVYWSADSKTIYFDWNPDKNTADSTYSVSINNHTPQKVTVREKREIIADRLPVYNDNHTAFVYNKNGDIYYTVVKGGITKRITNTIETESGPQFSFGEKKIVYYRGQNLYAWDIATGETEQLTNISVGAAGPASMPVRNGATSLRNESSSSSTTQDAWLRKDQLEHFEVLRTRKEKQDATTKYNSSNREKSMRSISMDGKSLRGMSLSNDGNFIGYILYKAPSVQPKNTIVPNYVTESGYTEDISARSKVGGAAGTSELFVYDRVKDTIYTVKLDSLEGVKDIPAYLGDYPAKFNALKTNPPVRNIAIQKISWSPDSKVAVIELKSADNKDRWLAKWDTLNKKITVLDRQHDEAWIGGPGINSSATGWLDKETFWYQSEKTGYSHLYTVNVHTGNTKQLTTGNYEVQNSSLSTDKRHFYMTTNEVHPGEKHFYKLNIATGKKEQLTNGTGAHQVSLSPDEQYLAILYSTSTNPWELYIQSNKVGAKSVKITSLAQSEEFKSYPWRSPEVVEIPARDGETIYARIYKPQNPDPNKPAVLFVHGAGYLQNAHKWWSQYFREFMFNNLLADKGYYVLDIDYRASAGYGRAWRTGIYRHMGGKDLSDHTDAVNYLVKNYGVNPANVGIYGGSYGGFISLMALFTEPNVYAAGAALRPVTDWAQYNHGYTANILNEPVNDSIAYRRSSPLYFADGLKGHLLICHGMVDVNVHFQDVVKLSQRLIELGKDNWELAVYPMEDHGFIEPSSWTDEYKRIFNLFEKVLRKKE